MGSKDREFMKHLTDAEAARYVSLEARVERVLGIAFTKHRRTGVLILIALLTAIVGVVVFSVFSK